MGDEIVTSRTGGGFLSRGGLPYYDLYVRTAKLQATQVRTLSPLFRPIPSRRSPKKTPTNPETTAPRTIHEKSQYLLQAFFLQPQTATVIGEKKNLETNLMGVISIPCIYVQYTHSHNSSSFTQHNTIPSNYLNPHFRTRTPKAPEPTTQPTLQLPTPFAPPSEY